MKNTPVTSDELQALSETLSCKGINYCAGPSGHAWFINDNLDEPKEGTQCLCGKEAWKRKIVTC